MSRVNKQMIEMLRIAQEASAAEAKRRQSGEVQRPDWCLCSDEYWERDMDDPACRHDELGLREFTIDNLHSWLVSEYEYAARLRDFILDHMGGIVTVQAAGAVLEVRDDPRDIRSATA
jgi:hypothetical protein